MLRRELKKQAINPGDKQWLASFLNLPADADDAAYLKTFRHRSMYMETLRRLASPLTTAPTQGEVN